MTTNFPRRCLASLAAVILAGAAMVRAEEGKRPPNIIFILADDVSADELSPYGGAITMLGPRRCAVRRAP
jgi:hypothetical protein